MPSVRLCLPASAVLQKGEHLFPLFPFPPIFLLPLSPFLPTTSPLILHQTLPGYSKVSFNICIISVNLSVANHVHIMEPHWNPMVEAQAVDRVHRMGQTKDVVITRYLIKNSIEFVSACFIHTFHDGPVR